MITDEELEASVAEIELLAGLGSEPMKSPPDDSRVDRIVEMAMYQAVMKDSISFVFKGFATALSGMGTGVLGAIAHPGTTED